MNRNDVQSLRDHLRNDLRENNKIRESCKSLLKEFYDKAEKGSLEGEMNFHQLNFMRDILREGREREARLIRQLKVVKALLKGDR